MSRGRPHGRTSGERAHETSVELEVPFHDVDLLGVVWHGHYLKYFELARTQLLRSRKLDSGELIGARYRFMVIETSCRHLAPLRYGERARVSAWVRDDRHKIDIAYEITNLSRAERSATGHTTIATLDREGRLMLPTPEPIRECLRA